VKDAERLEEGSDVVVAKLWKHASVETGVYGYDGYLRLTRMSEVQLSQTRRVASSLLSMKSFNIPLAKMTTPPI
jgi:hypothetical protein